MIASDRVRLDGLIRQWEEEAKEPIDGQRGYLTAMDAASHETLIRCAEELRAALLVLGDARPQEIEEK